MTHRISSLAFLKDNYKSDSDDDEENRNMVTAAHQAESKLVPSKLPFPESVKKLRWSWQPEEIIDDPEQHDGRLRSFPHERGNWASCIFVPISKECSKQLSVISDSFIEICRNNADFHPFPQYHISLSRTVVLRHHWINPLVDDIRKRISCIRRFLIDFNDVRIYTNDEKSRTFISLQVQTGFSELERCVKNIDSCLAEFDLPVYYEDPSFHVSLIWCVGDKKAELQSLLPDLRKQFNSVQETDNDLSYKNVTAITCKTGNILHNIELKS